MTCIQGRIPSFTKREHILKEKFLLLVFQNIPCVGWGGHNSVPSYAILMYGSYAATTRTCVHQWLGNAILPQYDPRKSSLAQLEAEIPSKL